MPPRLSTYINQSKSNDCFPKKIICNTFSCFRSTVFEIVEERKIITEVVVEILLLSCYFKLALSYYP